MGVCGEVLEITASFVFESFVEVTVSSSSGSSYSNTQKATYSISAHASQQGTTEGMSKLASLLTDTMEPIVVESKS